MLSVCKMRLCHSRYGRILDDRGCTYGRHSAATHCLFSLVRHNGLEESLRELSQGQLMSVNLLLDMMVSRNM